MRKLLGCLAKAAPDVEELSKSPIFGLRKVEISGGSMRFFENLPISRTLIWLSFLLSEHSRSLTL